MEEVQLEILKCSDVTKKIALLHSLRNELIGNKDKKDHYFQKGIIESLMPMLGKEEDDNLLIEVITIINCYFFDFPQAIEVFTIFSHTFVQLHYFLQTNAEKTDLVDAVLRVIKNALYSDIVKPTDFENQKMIESLVPFMTTKYRIQIIAKILALLCEGFHFREEIATHKELILAILDLVVHHNSIISDECIENCLQAVAVASQNNREICHMISNESDAVKQICSLTRHPDRFIKIQISKILANVNKVEKLPREYDQTFRWILMQMIQMLPVVSHDARIVIDICGVIQLVATESRQSKQMQKLAGDIEAIEKICEIQLHQINLEDLETLVSEKENTLQPMLQKSLFLALAALTSFDENCRKKLVEKKKVLEELLVEAGDFQKELCNIVLHSDKDPELELAACKAITNLILDIQKAFSKEEELIKKLVNLTECDNEDLKVTAACALKNFLFKSTKEIKNLVMRELTYERLRQMLDDDIVRVREQGLLIYRNILSSSDDIQTVMSESGDSLLTKFHENFNDKEHTIIVQTLFCLACIASGSQKYKKIIMDEFLDKAIELLLTTEVSKIKVAILNLFLNLLWKKDNDRGPDSSTRKHMIEINLKDKLVEERQKTNDLEVKQILDRVINKFN